MNPLTVMPVLIVGAGPTGMTAALDLAHHGIPSIILDEDYRLGGGSRAIAFHQSALAVWEKLGAAQPMLELGIPWSVRHTFRGEKKLYAQDFGRPASGFLPRFINLPQYEVERILLERVKASPFIELRWDHKVTGFSQNAGSATVTVETAAGRKQIGGLYLLACDGARSSLRKLLNLDFPGRTFNDYFLIADIKVDLGLPPEPRFFFDHPTNPGQTILIHPQPDGVWRIDWQIGRNPLPAAETNLQNMDRRIKALIGAKPYEIVWLSTYRFHQRLLDQFRHGRVFFAGDAAHLVAPFGARGLNSAIQDIENLGWKLAFVLKGLAAPGLLDTYQLERWPAQAENQRVTLATMRFMAPDSAWLRLRRDAILRLSGFYDPARRWVDSGKMTTPFVYTDTPLQGADRPGDDWRGALPLGARLPDLPVRLNTVTRPAPQFLRQLLGSGFVALYFAGNSQAALQLAANLKDLPPGLPFKAYPVTKEPVGDLESLLDPDQTLAAALSGRAGTLYLVRPDGHLALRRRSLELVDLMEYLNLNGRFK